MLDVKVLLKDQRMELIDKFKKAIEEVRSAYPESVFPSDWRTNDSKNAKQARKTCDDIWRVFNEKERKEKVECKVVPVSKYPQDHVLYNPASPYVWEKYRDWEGVVIRERRNGEEAAYEVRISKDKVYYCNAVINKIDVEIL